jgi:hypothetical protein
MEVAAGSVSQGEASLALLTVICSLPLIRLSRSEDFDQALIEHHGAFYTRDVAGELGFKLCIEPLPPTTRAGGPTVAASHRSRVKREVGNRDGRSARHAVTRSCDLSAPTISTSRRGSTLMGLTSAMSGRPAWDSDRVWTRKIDAGVIHGSIMRTWWRLGEIIIIEVEEGECGERVVSGDAWEIVAHCEVRSLMAMMATLTLTNCCLAKTMRKCTA